MPQTKGTWVGKIGFRRMGGYEGGPRRPGWDKSWAWWYLSRHQKEMLARERKQGRFGGRTDKVAYMWIQELGEAKAHVRGQHFMRLAIGDLLGKQGEIIDRHLHG